MLALAACGAPPPQPIASTAPVRPRAIVAVPEADRELFAIEGTLLVDYLGKLYLLRGVRGGAAIEIPERTPVVALADLELALRSEGARIKGPRPTPHPSANPALVVMAANTPASRVGEVGDALAAAGYCFVPVLRRGRALGTFITECTNRDDHHSVQASVFVTRHEVWLGIARINEFETAAHRDGVIDRDRLAALVGQWKAMAFFADRDDIDLAGDRDVTYAELLTAGSITAKAGFTAIRIVSPMGAAAIPKR